MELVINQFTFASPWFYATVCFVVAVVCGSVTAVKIERARASNPNGRDQAPS